MNVEPVRATVPRPPPSVRVPNETLDRFLSTVGEVILTTSQLRTAAETNGIGQDARLSGGFDQMDRVVGELKRRALALRTTPLLRVMENLPRVAREVAMRTGKRIEVTLAGAELELDRSILDRLYDPLVHVVRNAVDHGLEPPEVRKQAGKSEVGNLRIEATREKDAIRIAVSDDGAGMNLAALRERAVAAGLVHATLADDLPPDEIVELAFHPGLSTATSVSAISGRGVGMDAVRSTLESLGGAVRLETRPGAGTTAVLRVPIAAAVQRVLLVVLGGETVAVPISKVERVVELDAGAIEGSAGECFALIDKEPVLVLDLAQRLGWPAATNHSAPLVIAELRGERVALRVERLSGQQDIYVKPLPALLASLRVLAGLTVLGDGRPVFLLDLNQLP
ncbi:MAG: CheA signal transduction histidine kinase [Deltaproteobacteria bacterium]|nr:CheA signal transduction histidine kinase [Deltaproteobacteria bacterium]